MKLIHGAQLFLNPKIIFPPKNLQHFKGPKISLLRNDPPLVPVQKKINPFRSLPPYFLKILFNIILLNIPSSYEFSATRYNCVPLFLHHAM